MLNLNLDLNPLLLEDYKEARLNELNEPDSSRNGDTMNWEQFRHLYNLILRNQSTYFREIYNNKNIRELDLQKHLSENEENLKMCFRIYDVDDSGYLCYKEFKEMLQELNLHKQFARHWDPTAAFDNFVDGMWYQFDLNADGRMSYDEFVTAYNNVLDR